MKIAVIGSRHITDFDLYEYIPDNVTEIVSGGARGVDTLARNFAIENGLFLKEFLPDYNTYGRRAPLIRSNLIIDYADAVLAIWDGESHGTAYVIDRCKMLGKPLQVVIVGHKSDDQLSMI